MIEFGPQLGFQLEAVAEVAELGAAQAGGIPPQHLDRLLDIELQMSDTVNFAEGALTEQALDTVFVEEGVVWLVGHCR